MNIKTVDIRQARTRLPARDGQSILETALQNGIPYPHGCRSGRCGSCKSRLIEGEVEMLPHSRFALTNEEKAGGLILACRAVPKTDVAVAWVVAAGEAAPGPAQKLQGMVVSIDDLTHDIKRFRIRPDGAALAFSAGQYADLGFGELPSRSYSMANRPGDPELEFHIRRVRGGAVSDYVHAFVKTGDRVALEAPRGASHLREYHGGPMLCVAGGSGLAPIKSIVETALAHGVRQAIHIYFGARTERDLYLVEHFEGLARQNANLFFTPVLSRAKTTPRRQGIVTQAVADDLPDLANWKAYVAGPPPMVDAAMESAFARGLKAEDMHADVFFTPQDQAASGAAE
ncbi:2Fe-2S iron-sulfur cluster-binding protein [Achromobacter pestifer]|uniref:Naphthalene 1,2-dioxygenase system ferredoxin--NAD(P)(+), reductase component n=1 Tax=Achromobacter pestifer TaxID=1353889 RepID=A0A6S6YPI1_9BURK|nr:2Fe-2S iron-sulfur cluster-binding protein [Achromobacter pestifer]CAB3634959.1 Naphthalene 1,2-dioxygenase system ferredoxin--NAD(P)(+), reductase component [Achromobacter pestifer]